jgi:hypothetical protein
MDAVSQVGRIIKDAAERTRDQNGLACAKFVCFANAVEDNPFMAGAFHGVGEAEAVINVGVSGPGVVHHAVRQAGKDLPLQVNSLAVKLRAGWDSHLESLIYRWRRRRSLEIQWPILSRRWVSNVLALMGLPLPLRF